MSILTVLLEKELSPRDLRVKSHDVIPLSDYGVVLIMEKEREKLVKEKTLPLEAAVSIHRIFESRQKMGIWPPNASVTLGSETPPVSCWLIRPSVVNSGEIAIAVNSDTPVFSPEFGQRLRMLRRFIKPDITWNPKK